MAPETAFILRVSLDRCQPPVWRRLLVCGRTTLRQLHMVIQSATGWTNSHLYEFRIDPHRYTALETLDEKDGSRDARRMTVARAAATSGGKFEYYYDFGDAWLHTVEVESSEPKRAGILYPRCLAGKRACPPEDCGGVDGYFEFLEALLANPRHPEHHSMRTWIGCPFDPEAFDLDEVNRRLMSHSWRSCRTG